MRGTWCGFEQTTNEVTTCDNRRLEIPHREMTSFCDAMRVCSCCSDGGKNRTNLNQGELTKPALKRLLTASFFLRIFLGGIGELSTAGVRSGTRSPTCWLDPIVLGPRVVVAIPQRPENEGLSPWT